MQPPACGQASGQADTEPARLVPPEEVELGADQTRHARRVLRLTSGAPVQLIDGQGLVAQATLIGDDPRSARCRVTAIQQVPRATPCIELATAIPKGPRGDAMINDLAQLGVDRLIPIITQRSVVNPGASKLQRFAKAAAEAAKQSGRAWLMRVDPVQAWPQALACDADLKLLAHPRADPASAWRDRLDSVNTVRVLIGPEGGLTDDEQGQARDAGFLPWCFSPNVLRVETAAAASVAILRSTT